MRGSEFHPLSPSRSSRRSDGGKWSGQLTILGNCTALPATRVQSWITVSKRRCGKFRCGFLQCDTAHAFRADESSLPGDRLARVEPGIARNSLQSTPSQVTKLGPGVEREAQTAALKHPNICTVYEIEEFDGRPFIAMEVVEGRSVMEELLDRPLPLAEGGNVGLQFLPVLVPAQRRKKERHHPRFTSRSH